MKNTYPLSDDIDFEKFKEKYLDNEDLSEDALTELKVLYKLFSDGSGSARLSCDDMHGHGYKCVMYDNPHSAVVDRLILELRGYQSILKNIHKKSDLSRR